MNISENGLIKGRKIEFFNHNTEPEWGYKEDQNDTFAVIHPMNESEGKEYPFYVVFHSAGHDIYSTISCMMYPGNHDIYHTPADSFALVLDARTNEDNDWWWGGIDEHGYVTGEKADARRGKKPTPVENRVISTIEWVMQKYSIDEQRVYAVGNSMGGTGALGVAGCRGDIFAAIKVNVPAGVIHISERCGFFTDSPVDCPDFPIIIDYSAQNDIWSKGHEKLYAAAEKYKIPLMGFWGNFGHENNNGRMYEFNDLIHSFDISKVVKNEAYPIFTNASTDDRIPWPDDLENEAPGQVNAFFRWKIVSDSEEKLEVELRLLNKDEWNTRVELPLSSVADVSFRRLQKFSPSDRVHITYGEISKDVDLKSGLITIEKLEITDKPTLLTITK